MFWKQQVFARVAERIGYTHAHYVARCELGHPLGISIKHLHARGDTLL